MSWLHVKIGQCVSIIVFERLNTDQKTKSELFCGLFSAADSHLHIHCMDNCLKSVVWLIDVFLNNCGGPSHRGISYTI